MAKRSKKVSTQPVGKAIKLAIKQLRAVRRTADAKGKKHIDLNIKALSKSYDSIKVACKGSWTSPL
ncbi:MAG: hypothetical protein M1453_02110 [Acidobacteria bacterium]|nr:hypothetical protein [Acidobacteriota bacterium]MCL5286778.1 hypothetical protein [Acidobacteriota bacterium]